jgi:hypothetical protein
VVRESIIETSSIPTRQQYDIYLSLPAIEENQELPLLGVFEIEYGRDFRTGR